MNTKHLGDVIIEAAAIEYIDDAFKMVQDAIGVDSGDVASRFSLVWEEENDLEMREFWYRGLQSNRREILSEYIMFEIDERR